MNNANKKIALISDYFNLSLIILFIIFIKTKIFSDYQKVHSGKIPWIVLARHFGHRAVFTAQREGMIWNNIRQLASGIIIPISLKKPIVKKGFNFFNLFFIMRIGIFQDIADYEIWKTKSVERTAEGKRAKQSRMLD